MLPCPNCSNRLNRQVSDLGVAFICPNCGGRAIGVGALHKADISDQFIEKIWEVARGSDFGSRACPHCGRHMAIVTTPAGDDIRNLDICVHCHSIWFDPSEHQGLPHKPPPPPPPKPLSGQARLALMNVELEARKETFENTQKPPDQSWQKVLGFAGMPVEHNRSSFLNKPLLTWGIAAVCIIIFFATLGRSEQIVRAFGFIPLQWYRLGGLTLFTSFFLHGSLLHLLGNLYFLISFGDNIESRFGKLKFLALLFGSHLAGLIAHYVFFPHNQTVMIGASGGIMGIVAFYAFVFPKARISLLFIVYFRPYWMRVSPGFMLFLYILFEIIQMIRNSVTMQQDNIAHLAHFGGLAVGIIAGLWLKSVEKERRQAKDSLPAID